MEENNESSVIQEPRKKTVKWLWWIIYAVAVQIVVFLAVYFWFLNYADSPGPLAFEQKTKVVIPPGSSLGVIQQLLAEQKIVNPDMRFDLLARKMGVDQQLRAGEYFFSGPVSPRQVLAKLAKGDVILHPVTIPEGVNIYQLADILTEKCQVDRRHFLDLVTDPDFIKKTGMAGESLEGYLFPDTYHFVHSQDEGKIIKMMMDRFSQVYDELLAALPGAPSMTRHQVVILASIVEKETGMAKERPVIAAVFLNRLRKKMFLQADPTVIYGLKKFDGNLTRRDLRNPTPYNTYQRKGLPAGPICNPGREALAAVLHPAEEDYLYFVSRNDGSHYFSKSLTEHNRAVYRFQK